MNMGADVEIFNILRCPNADMKILQNICLHVKKNATQILHYNTFHILRYAHFSYVTFLFANIQKQ